jgi:phosphoglucosamine mutase
MLLKFGTDGVRGVANTTLTAEFAVLLGRASATILAESEWLIGWDTRMSSEMLAGAFCAGVASAGKTITALGEVPTAAVALSCRSHGLPGAMVTASHNPYEDNGIKIFGPTGVKLRDDIERKIERLISNGGGHTSEWDIGRIRWNSPKELREEHKRWLEERARTIDARELHIALDCANGAAYKVAPGAIKATGAAVSVIASRPDGRNINHKCGSTDLERLKNRVTQRGLDFGLALDGDADRLLAVDAKGIKVNGDEIIAILAEYRAKHGSLARRGVVVTEWSNLGLRKSLNRAGIEVKVCDVGDKAVAEAMKQVGFVLGGEQSGHVIMSDLLPVGDGVSTAIELIAAVVDAGLPLSKLAAHAMTKLPQQTKNIPVTSPPALVVEKLKDEWEAINESLEGNGRLVLRPSGTESVVRIMAEAEDRARVSQVIAHMVELLKPYSSEPAVHVAGLARTAERNEA